jgi:hypothetical protein
VRTKLLKITEFLFLIISNIRACSTNWGEKNAYRILVGKPEGKRPLGKPRRRWVDNIKMDLTKR